MWNATSGSESASVAHPAEVTAVALGGVRGDLIVAGTRTGGLLLHKVGKTASAPQSFVGHVDGLRSVALAPVLRRSAVQETTPPTTPTRATESPQTEKQQPQQQQQQRQQQPQPRRSMTASSPEMWKSAKTKDDGPMQQFKLLVVGDAGAGKTSIIRQSCDGYFSDSFVPDPPPPVFSIGNDLPP